MIDIDSVKQQVVQFLAEQNQRETEVLSQSFLIKSGHLVGVRFALACASAIWLFDEPRVRIDLEDDRVSLPIGAGIMKKAA